MHKGSSRMRKGFFIITAVLLVIGIITYLQSSTIAISKENIIYITITNNCSDEIYGIHYENKLYERLGIGSIVHADGTLIKMGEVLTIEFTPTNLLKDDLLGFTIEYFVILEDATEMSCGIPMKLNVEYGGYYGFSLSGNRVSGFKVEKED